MASVWSADALAAAAYETGVAEATVRVLVHCVRDLLVASLLQAA